MGFLYNGFIVSIILFVLMPTIKQKMAMNKLSENIRLKKPITMGAIMREVGYSQETSLAPQRLTESKGWQELLNENFPDDRIQKIINKALKEYEEEGEIGDKRAFLGLMDMILKLKDKYPAGKLKIGAFDERDRVVE